MLELVYLSYSPWSERARWALDHHRLEYKSSPYTPMIGEVPLRLRLGKWSGKVTVPVLFTDAAPVRDSTDIARYADGIGKGLPLVPAGKDAEVLSWVQRADEALEAGRNLVTRRTGSSADARRESLPPPLRKTGPLGDALARSGVRFFMRKYGLDTRSEAEDVDVVARILESLRGALAGRPTILERLSFADIAMAGVIQLVVPVQGRHLKLGPVTRTVWSTPSLAARYPDLVEWRDRLYASYRDLPA